MKKLFSCLLLIFGFTFMCEAQLVKVIPKDTVKVLRVHDGDSYYVLQSNGVDSSFFWIRIPGLDCPEVISNHITENQPYGVAIGDSIRQLIKGDSVIIQVIGKDYYFRTLAKITLLDESGTDLAEYILSKGWAWYLGSQLDQKTRNSYMAARDKARKAKLGIWSDYKIVGKTTYYNAITPSVWRKTHWKE